jgi:phosphoacetylglucosamine mutase
VTDGDRRRQCGADHVKTTQSPPVGLPLAVGARYATVDGDGDRLLYFYLRTGACGASASSSAAAALTFKNGPWRPSDGSFGMLDGDRIATLAAQLLQTLARAAGLALTVGVVQTAYANGNATAYVAERLGVTAVCAKTGVKHVHHAAQAFDVGVYFEANGHGTVLFSEAARARIAAAAPTSPAAAQLAQLILLINQTVGDALSDLLLVEAALVLLGLDMPAWEAQYADLPSRLSKVAVRACMRMCAHKGARPSSVLTRGRRSRTGPCLRRPTLSGAWCAQRASRLGSMPPLQQYRPAAPL